MTASGVCGVGNPLEEKHSGEGDWRDMVAAKLKKLSKLDGASHAIRSLRLSVVLYVSVVL